MKVRSTVLFLGVLVTISPALAQTPGGDVADAVRSGFSDVSGHIAKAAEMVPPDKYTYQPTRDVRTYGQLLAHIIDGYNYFCSVASGKKIEWSDATEKGTTDKATLTAKLSQATSACAAIYAGKNQLQELVRNNEHTNLHYGNMVTYLRMLGLKPPSS